MQTADAQKRFHNKPWVMQPLLQGWAKEKSLSYEKDLPHMGEDNSGQKKILKIGVTEEQYSAGQKSGP